jgi:hypothetical protein
MNLDDYGFYCVMSRHCTDMYHRVSWVADMERTRWTQP